MEVALFIPCYVDQFYPNVGLATVDLLERYGAKVEFPEEQTCCGQPMANSGCFADAAPLAAKFLDVFSPYQDVVCPSGSCTSMVRNHYLNRLPNGRRLAPMGRRHCGLCELLHDFEHLQPRGRFAHRVGLHESWHGLRERRLGSGSERRIPAFDKVRDLLAGLEGLQLVELARPDECCGFGGTFAVSEEAVSC